MGSIVSRLNDDFIRIPATPYERYDPERLLVMDVSDIFDDMHQHIVTAGEVPAYGHLNNEYFGAFVFDLYEEISFLPDHTRLIAANINGLLDTASQYFDCVMLSWHQRQCWFYAAQQLVDRLIEYRFYCPRDRVHQYDFHEFNNGTLYLRRP